MHIAKNLQYLRKRDHITQEELADKLDVSRQSVSKWETGDAYPETEKLLVLCDLFGVSLDDLMRNDLGAISDEQQETRTSCDPKNFNAHMNAFSYAMAVGVFLIILGVAICVALSGYSTGLSGTAKEITSIMSGVTVIVFVAAAVFLFVFFGIGHDRFRKENPDAEPDFDDAEIKSFGKRFAVAMACLVAGVLMDVVYLIIITTLVDSNVIATSNKDAATCYVVAAFLAILSFIVGGFVYLGIQHSKYDKEEYRKQNGSVDKNSPREKIKSAICGAVMLTATATFILLGVIGNYWNPGWVVFPVGGIICAIVNTVMNAKK